MSLPLNCPLCNANIDSQIVVSNHVFGSTSTKKSAFFKCQKCEVIYQYPGLTKDEESKFYADEFEKFMSSRSGKSGGWDNVEKHINANLENKNRRLEYLKPFLKEKSKVLEVGCSSGFMLYPLIEKGHECIGIEPSGVFSKHLIDYGIKIFEDIDYLYFENSKYKFDLIMHFFVLEHIKDPMNFISKQINLLNKGGTLIFEIPNSADALHSIYDIPAFERFYWSVAHPWYFNEKSLKYLLDSLNLSYELIRDQRYDLSNHMVWARDGRPGGMKRFTEKFGNELEEIYKKELINSGFCDTLVAIIKN